ncbi:MAG: EVE domain-containing protein [Verrucomicrobia bacterium]|nr:EVE domain-containing protein [Verrucomicrobiota bacterium]MDA1007149.1 EVE domain-containing protein [Verrucomicrobiota bacterium]
MRYWLIKSEPDVFSIKHLRKVKQEPWDGVRNYQARNFMRDDMKQGDLALFYHSNTEVPGVVGVAKVVSEAYPDATQWQKKSKYYDPKSSEDKPRWVLVDFTFESEFKSIVSLAAMKADPKLEGMRAIQKGNRLSITPVEAKDFKYICKLGG